jgi:quercetin dioxygenase-like cupin family protein
MSAGYWKDRTAEPMAMEGAWDVSKRVLVGPADGWDGYVMRAFELGPGGHTPRHVHAWPHINIGLEGEGVVVIGGVEHELRAGSYAFVPAGIVHQFRAAGEASFAFVCIVPEEGDPQAGS